MSQFNSYNKQLKLLSMLNAEDLSPSSPMKLSKMQQSPIRRSFSVSAIIHGDQKMQKTSHYIDSLQRFKRDYASKDQQERNQKREKMLANLQKRRKMQLQRENQYKNRQNTNLMRIINQNQKAMQIRKIGNQISSFSNSIAVNPVNLKYEDSLRGRYQQQVDTQKLVNKLVRTHHLQTCGTSGYNIINGSPINYKQSLLPKGESQKYQTKLHKYYSQFSIKPQSTINAELNQKLYL